MTYVWINQSIECHADTDTKDLDTCEGCHYFQGFKDSIREAGAVRCGWKEGDVLPDELEYE
jgi:hypothetical protein